MNIFYSHSYADKKIFLLFFRFSLCAFLLKSFVSLVYVKVATISANNDVHIGNLIAGAMKKVRRDMNFSVLVGEN